jgi:chemotaxis protein MotB
MAPRERETTSEMVGNAAPPWMSSMSDVITQVLCFFVMLFSFSVVKQQQQLEHVKKDIDKVVEKEKLEGVSTKIDPEKGLIISMKEKILFETGRAELNDAAKHVLDVLLPVLLKYPNDIIIEGHTDNVPIHNVQFPSNWELSTARAVVVVRYLVEEKKAPPKKFSACGYSEYYPVADNSTEEGRAKNRRVDMVVAPLKTAQRTASDKLLLIGIRELEEKGQ